jgi:hypothetical protein
MTIAIVAATPITIAVYGVSADVMLLQRWVGEWSDLVDFEIIPVVQGKDAGEALLGEL